ncbi:hypothetical protein ACIGZI_34705 [Streptomyces griseus]|uniref:hypothetical protein n=1 Tax=Streptomyces griseus TaxID=1911 RepID=UPI0037D53F37
MAANGWDNPEIAEGTRVRLTQSSYEGFWRKGEVLLAQVRKLDRGTGTAEILLIDSDANPLPRKRMPFFLEIPPSSFPLRGDPHDNRVVARAARSYKFDLSSVPSKHHLVEEWMAGDWTETISLADYPVERVREPWSFKGLIVGDMINFVATPGAATRPATYNGTVAKLDDEKQILSVEFVHGTSTFEYGRVEMTLNLGAIKA